MKVGGNYPNNKKRKIKYFLALRWKAKMLKIQEADQLFCPASFQVIIDEPLDYSNRSISDDIENLITELEGHPNIAKIGTESWLRQFSDYVKSVEGDPFQGIDISDEQNFNEGLISVRS